ncbi:glycoside hydrolase family 1 protein [Niallia taxi]|uniref:glycoside hydrolase family 1 protein n=1 Tax=Niallia taxi TaxID=2499688 RepID=UPI002E1C9F10|nr:glycoside hydrolase family 1 protein [Niallia taxi]
MNKIQFPKDFLWGTASSGPQSEGYKHKKNDSIWDYWYKKEPERFYNQVGPETTSNVYEQYAEDVSIMKELNLNSFRTSIQWSRLIKDFETGEVDQEAAQFYNRYIDEMIANGIEPMMNLFHFDMPYELEQKYGGFKSRHVVDLYVKFAEAAFELFGDRVKYWISFNEPVAYTKGAYWHNLIYPNEMSMQSYVQANYHILLAHSLIVSAYRKGNYSGEIGIVVDLLPPIPRSENPADVEAGRIADLFINLIFMDPCVRGEYDQDYLNILKKHDCMFHYHIEDLEAIKENTVDFIGINYYQPMRVKARDSMPNPFSPFTPEWYYEPYEMPNRRMNEYRGWEIYPKALYDIAMRVKNEYGNIKWYVSENGMGVQGEERFKNKDGFIEDDYRIDFIKEHLGWLAKAIDEGSNCFGYHLWTFVDNWSWTNAYKNRYGLVSLNLDKTERTIKKSGNWIKEAIKNNDFS